jgi:alpha-glucuronidase
MKRHGIRLSITFALLILLAAPGARADDGYELWLRYQPVSDAALLQHYRASAAEIVMADGSPTLRVAREELQRGLLGLLGAEVPVVRAAARGGSLIVGTPASSAPLAALGFGADLQRAGEEGYIIRTVQVDGRPATAIAANTDVGVLYGVFHFLKLLQTHQRLDDLALVEAPLVQHRILNHWDNLDRTVERGYAGFSLWDWHKLPDYLDPRYTDYARANASIGINGTVTTNANGTAAVNRGPPSKLSAFPDGGAESSSGESGSLSDADSDDDSDNSDDDDGGRKRKRSRTRSRSPRRHRSRSRSPRRDKRK